MRWATFLRSLPIAIDDETTTRAWTDTMNIARTRNLSAYDACYLELALRLGVGLATLDGGLKAAAIVAGVPLYEAQIP